MAFQISDRTYSFDAGMLLADGAAAQTATGFTQVAGADGIVDLGGNQGITYTAPSIADVATLKFQQARIDAMLVVDLTALNIATADEKYNLQILLSNDPGFGAGKVEMAAEYSFGKGAQRDGVNMIDSVVGRYEIPFVAQQAGQRYEYVKLRVTVAGTGPSITFTAFIAVQAKE